MAPGRYTELFFLDEAVALAAGHRPCFECRREDARAYAACWGGSPRAGEMDRVLHAERLDGRRRRIHIRECADLPDGAFVSRDGAAWLIRGALLLRYTPRRIRRRDRAPRRCGRGADAARHAQGAQGRLRPAAPPVGRSSICALNTRSAMPEAAPPAAAAASDVHAPSSHAAGTAFA